MKKTLFLSLLAGLAFAQDGPREGRPRFANPLFTALDTNGDGVISADELRSASKSLKALDKSGSGQLTAADVRPGPPAERMNRQVNVDSSAGDDMVATLMSFDKNGDGQLSRDEVPERMQGLFNRGDKNKDGVLSKDEIAQLAAAQPAGPRDEGRREGGGGPGGRGGGFNRPDPLFLALDLNGDGIISADEMRQAPASLAKIDKNGDGQITMDEIRPNFNGGGAGPNVDDMISRMISQFDKDGDGRISKAEAPERMQEMFDRADVNHDGFLSKEELRAAFASQRGRER